MNDLLSPVTRRLPKRSYWGNKYRPNDQMLDIHDKDENTNIQNSITSFVAEPYSTTNLQSELPNAFILTQPQNVDESYVKPKAEEERFAQSLVRYDSDIFSLIEDFQNICHQSCILLSNQFGLKDTNISKVSNAFNRIKEQEYHLLLQERNTWLLIHDLERARRENLIEDNEWVTSSLERFMLSESEAIFNIIKNNQEIFQNKIVINWLEAIVDQPTNFLQQDGLWKSTLSAYRKPNVTQLNLISQLDPDAPFRESRSLHPDDMEDDQRLIEVIWQLLREGKLSDAQQLCRDCGHYWRAASLTGLQHYHDDGFAIPEGNPYRSLWKFACYQLSNQEGISQYESAIYGILSDNLERVLPVCKTWEDHLWANFTVLMNTRIEARLRDLVNPISIEDNLEQITTFNKNELQIFVELKNNSNVEIRSSAFDKYHLIQEKIILGKIDEMFVEISSWIDYKVPSSSIGCPSHLMRFAAHMVLFYFTSGLPEIGDSEVLKSCSSILCSYIYYLIHTKQIYLIALYTSKLPGSLQVEMYANFLKDIKDNSEREKCLLLAEKAELNVSLITKRVVEIIRSSSQTDVVFHEESANLITADDLKKIRAIEWLIFDPAHRSEALVQSNAIARTFIAAGRLEAASKLFEVLPNNSVALVTSQGHDIEVEVKNAIKEHLCFRDYLTSIKMYSMWRSHHFSRPATPQQTGTSYSEELSYTRQLVSHKEHFTAWKEVDEQLSLETIEAIYKVITFPQGWLRDENSEEHAVDDRTNQMESLRRQCIPNLIFLLHTLLFETDRFDESLELALLVVDEHQNLYSLFTREELSQLLNCIRKSYIRTLQ